MISKDQWLDYSEHPNLGCIIKMNKEIPGQGRIRITAWLMAGWDGSLPFRIFCSKPIGVS